MSSPVEAINLFFISPTACINFKITRNWKIKNNWQNAYTPGWSLQTVYELVFITEKVKVYTIRCSCTFRPTLNANIPVMSTTDIPPANVRTILKKTLQHSRAFQIVQPYSSLSILYLAPRKCSLRARKSHLITRNVRVINIPTTVANCPPLTIKVYFYPAFVGFV
jgi:hypothetical protein